MIKHFSSIEDVISDEHFLAWYSTAGEDNSETWQQWLSANPQYAPLVAESIAFLDQLPDADRPVPQNQVERAHSRLITALQGAPVATLNSPYARWWRIGAAAVLFVVAGLLLFMRQDAGTPFKTGNGQRAHYKLPDGSEVVLNANSRLSVKDGWGNNKDREVWLEGEAFFHVRRSDLQQKFIVHGEAVDIIVTGTQFNAINRNGESSVLLTEGSITLEMRNGERVHMVPGDFVTVRNNKPERGAAPEEKILAWKQSKLVFERTTMREAARIINQHYGVKVILDKYIEEKRISGILANDNLDVLLKAIEAVLDCTITKKDNAIYISGSTE